jgi:hypothetical protein
VRFGMNYRTGSSKKKAEPQRLPEAPRKLDEPPRHRGTEREGIRARAS